VSGALADPVLELHKSDGTVVTNDNWKDTQQTAIAATGLAPTNDLESAIIANLPPGSYTAIVRGFALLARTAGLVAHLAEEMAQPMGMPLFREIDERVTYEPG
jgi:citrate synthase